MFSKYMDIKYSELPKFKVKEHYSMFINLNMGVY